MWRGFAVKKGLPEEARKFYHDLFDKLLKDPEWVAHADKMQVDPVYLGPVEFGKVVEADKAKVASGAMSLMTATRTSSRWLRMRYTLRPIRPNPLMATVIMTTPSPRGRAWRHRPRRSASR